MNLRSHLAISLGKATSRLLKASGRGATSAPGLYTTRLQPTVLKDLARDLDKTILITGTNGKTTTSRLLTNILAKTDTQAVHNRAGSNLIRGLVSTLLQQDNKGKVGVFEVDEAVLPEALTYLEPTVLVVNNLYRDQLDRYGEVSKIHSLWKEATAKLTPATTLILNGDDPNVADLGQNTRASVIYIGLDDPKISFKEAPHTIDARVCPKDGKSLRYDYYYLSHLGNYHCSGHDFRRPTPTVSAFRISLTEDQAQFTISFSGPEVKIALPISGVYNIYNALTAAAISYSLGIPRDKIKKGLEEYVSAFGRQQILKINEQKLRLNLVKNPVGYNEILRLLRLGQKDVHLLLYLNDRLADGTDVSWIWDVDFEGLKGRVASVVVSGDRAYELATRLKYAAIFPGEIQIEPTLEKALTRGLQNSPDQTLEVLPTYTAMLDLQRYLAGKGVIKPFWND